MPDRREVLIQSLTAAAFLGLKRAGLAALEQTAPGFGPLQPDARELFALPQGFSYRIIARAGSRMDDGFRLPGDPDGMAVFPGSGGKLILLCNHELDITQTELSAFGRDLRGVRRFDREFLFDPGGRHPALGGVTRHVYDPATGAIEESRLVLAGTERNCAGGPTPWQSWLSCEESVVTRSRHHGRDHGWVFEVPAAATGPVRPEPLRAMGRFNHEAAAVDPHTGIVYLTEDQPDGLLYRFLPEKPGELAAGGRLQALAFLDSGADDARNWLFQGRGMKPGRSMPVRWLDLDNVEAPGDDLRRRGHRRGAVLFARGEGMWFADDGFFFACTAGGPRTLGQIFRYRLSPGEGRANEADRPPELELFIESGDASQLKHCDNLTVAPWGDLLVCEDRDDGARLIGVTPDGALYVFGQNTGSDSELCGACFAPDGQTLFVNLQEAGLTLAIRGPFPDVAAAG